MGDLGRASAALKGGEWDEARAAFAAAVDEDGEHPEALVGLARSLWWLGDPAGAIEAWERAYPAERARGEDRRAARIALRISREYGAAFGNEPVALGWLARAESLLDAGGSSVERGWLEVARSERATRPPEAMRHSEEALRIGRAERDPDLELTALARLGLAEVETGDVRTGMGRFDEAMAAATGGEAADPETIGDVYCALVEACELALDNDRFMRWAPVMAGYLERHGHLSLLGFCGACCGELFWSQGRWREAEEELVRTLSALEATGQRARCVHPATRLAALRVRQGRLEEAERLLDGFEDLPEAVPPQVELHLAVGRPEVAAAVLLRRLNQIGWGTLLAAPLLALLVEVQVARGDPDTAAETAERLAEVGRRSGLERVEAEAELALGSVKVSKGGATAATHLERALEAFVRLGLPHHAARTHLWLARALAEESPEVAVEEGRRAQAGFEGLGTTRDADRAAEQLRRLGVAGRTGPKGVGVLSKREVEVLRLLGEGLTNAEIASRLFISTKTAGHHVSNILMKLNLRNRTEAGAYAHRYLAAGTSAE